jgi:methylglyoxal synthase
MDAVRRGELVLDESQRLTIGLVAHDRMKSSLLAWVTQNAEALAPHRFVATGTTGKMLGESLPQLAISPLKSGPFGGDQQMGALIAEGQLDALVFFQDVMTAQPHDVDVKALVRLSVLYELPVACNRATADMMVSSPMFGAKSRMPSYPDAQEAFAGWLERMN